MLLVRLVVRQFDVAVADVTGCKDLHHVVADVYFFECGDGAFEITGVAVVNAHAVRGTLACCSAFVVGHDFFEARCVAVTEGGEAHGIHLEVVLRAPRICFGSSFCGTNNKRLVTDDGQNQHRQSTDAVRQGAAVLIYETLGFRVHFTYVEQGIVFGLGLLRHGFVVL